MLPFRRIFHPTDFSAADRAAFAHAVKLTCLVQGELTMMHVDPTIERKDFEDFPRIRPLLARWGVLPEGSAKEDEKIGCSDQTRPRRRRRYHRGYSPTADRAPHRAARIVYPPT